MMIGDPCPKCGRPLVRRSGMFFWRGEYRDGAVCEKDNGLWTIDGEEIPPLRNHQQTTNTMTERR